MVWTLLPRLGGQPDEARQGGRGAGGAAVANGILAARRTWLGKSLDALPTREQVDRMIAREAARAERNGQPFSVVLFRLKGGRVGRGGAHRGLSRAERRLALTLLRGVRLTDEVGWFDDRHLCVLLPDTPADGARVFVDKLCDEVARKSPRPQSVIYTYPGGDHRHGKDGGRGGSDGGPPGGGGGPSGPPSGTGGVLKSGRSRIFGVGDAAGGFGSHNFIPSDGPRSGVASLDGLARDYRPDEAGFGSGGVAVLAPRVESRVSPTNAVVTLATRAELPETPAVTTAQPVRPLHALLVRPMPLWKRAIDVVGAAGGLLVLSPLFAVVAAAIRLTSPGPAVFTQKRSGLGGRVFTIYKFRTMCADAEAKKQALRKLSEQDGPAFKLTHDPRVTRVGRLLRKTSIDELPQLWNVLKGDMSLVGPRPLPVDEADGCERWQKRRLDVTPGLTCIWQIEGRSEVSFAEWVRMDVKYMRRLTLLHDLSILFKTVPAVLLRKGAR